jgi:hypothetical protein
MHNFKMFWDTIRCTEEHKDLSEGAREDMGDMERYWEDHVTELERNLSQRIYALSRLRSYIPRKELLGLVPSFFNAKALYMIDVFADPTGREVVNQSKGGGIVHRLQVKQNKAIRAVMGINPKECIGKKELLKCSKLTGLDEMSLRANYMLACFSHLRETLPT